MKEQVSTLEKGANILLSLMQLNIGGAETHVVELAKELKRKVATKFLYNPYIVFAMAMKVFEQNLLRCCRFEFQP